MKLTGKRSCFAYRNVNGKIKCEALKEMVCRQGNGECPFYKLKSEAEENDK